MLRCLVRVRSMMGEAFYTRCSICKGVILYVTFLFLSICVISEQLVFSRQLNVCMRRRSPQPTNQVTFRRVATIDLRCVLFTPNRLPRRAWYSRVLLSALRSLLTRRNGNERPDSNAMPLNLLQLMVCQAPNLRFGFLAHARRFAVERGSQDIGGGLSIWRAYFQYAPPSIVCAHSGTRYNLTGASVRRWVACSSTSTVLVSPCACPSLTTPVTER